MGRVWRDAGRRDLRLEQIDSDPKFPTLYFPVLLRSPVSRCIRAIAIKSRNKKAADTFHLLYHSSQFMTGISTAYVFRHFASVCDLVSVVNYFIYPQIVPPLADRQSTDPEHLKDHEQIGVSVVRSVAWHSCSGDCCIIAREGPFNDAEALFPNAFLSTISKRRKLWIQIAR